MAARIRAFPFPYRYRGTAEDIQALGRGLWHPVGNPKHMLPTDGIFLPRRTSATRFDLFP